MAEDKNQNLTKIRVTIPTQYLKKFDCIIDGFYLSRSEAIRSGMLSVLKDILGYENQIRGKVGNSKEDS